MKRYLLAIGGSILAAGIVAGANFAESSEDITVHKTPWCTCCEGWVKHMEDNGFAVKVIETEDLEPIRKEHNITDELMACHTAVIDGYAVEGHVPAADVKRLVEERPTAAGISVPGMPFGSPGMPSPEKEAYETLLFQVDGGTEVFAKH